MLSKEDNSIYRGLIVAIGKEGTSEKGKIKVRIPSRHGGTYSCTRIPDEKLPWMLTTVKFTDPDDIGAVVVVAYEGGDTAHPIIIGRIVI